MTIRVVIAEDEAIIRMDLRETLEEEGYEVVGETGRGDTAVDLVRELLPDLAILDIKMPGMDGLAAAGHQPGEALRGARAHRVQPARGGRGRPRRRRASVPRQAVPEERPRAGDRGRDRAIPGTAGADRRDRRPRRAARRPQGDRAGEGSADGRAEDERAGRLHVHPAHGDERALEDAPDRRAHHRGPGPSRDHEVAHRVLLRLLGKPSMARHGRRGVASCCCSTGTR